jgi:4-hydroxy-2-oxoheptanedioate aldolase
MPYMNGFKQALRDRRRQNGFWLTLGAVAATEIAADAGFDWVLVDMEHTSLDANDIVDHLRAARGRAAEFVVRVPWNEPVVVKRLLDQGVRTLMFPYVQSAEEARRAVAATRYPPNGIRGFAGLSRATDYGRRGDYHANAAEEICVIVQLETPDALKAAGAIAAVDGVDGLLIGPNDLATNMGHLGQPGAPAVQAAIRDTLGVLRDSGKAAGILDFSEAGAKAYYEAGFDFIAVAGDALILAREAERIARSFRS